MSAQTQLRPGSRSDAATPSTGGSADSASTMGGRVGVAARASRRARQMRRWLSRRGAGLAGIAALAAVGAGLVASSARVDVFVDGEVLAVRTYASTVGGVLGRLPVEIGHADAVRPGLDANVADGMLIDVARAVTVDVHVDGALAHRVVAPVGSVAGVLEHAGLQDVRDLDAQVVPAWTAPVFDGARVDVWVPQEVSLAVDGEVASVSTFVADVAGLLAEQGVQLGPFDVVSHGLGTPLDEVAHVTVERVTFEELVDEVIIERDDIRRNSTQLPSGQTRVEHEGRDGLRVDRYQVTVVDGEPVEQELVSQELVVEPEPRVTLIGVFEHRSSGSMVPVDDPVWDRLARCESGGNWQRVSANGMHYGGLQFLPSTWRAVGGTGLPHEHPREVQIEMGRRLQARSGWGQWPACADRLELR